MTDRRTDGQTDGRTDGIAIAYARLAYMLSRAKMSVATNNRLSNLNSELIIIQNVHHMSSNKAYTFLAQGKGQGLGWQGQGQNCSPWLGLEAHGLGVGLGLVTQKPAGKIFKRFKMPMFPRSRQFSCCCIYNTSGVLLAPSALAARRLRRLSAAPRLVTPAVITRRPDGVS